MRHTGILSLIGIIRLLSRHSLGLQLLCQSSADSVSIMVISVIEILIFCCSRMDGAGLLHMVRTSCEKVKAPIMLRMYNFARRVWTLARSRTMKVMALLIAVVSLMRLSYIDADGLTHKLLTDFVVLCLGCNSHGLIRESSWNRATWY